MKEGKPFQKIHFYKILNSPNKSLDDKIIASKNLDDENIIYQQ